MRAWKAVLLVNLALLVGLGWGWAVWGRRADRLADELRTARAAALVGGEREWLVRGVVRAVLPEINVLVVTHDDIPGYMPAMTMGFRAASPKIHEAVRVGDEVRFTLRGVVPNVVITDIEKTSG
jgi:Cu/Ag efflux protein CusF